MRPGGGGHAAARAMIRDARAVARDLGGDITAGQVERYFKRYYK